MKKHSIKQYDLVIFDLDNTLYSEKDYLFPAYENIAKLLDIKRSLEIKNFLCSTFEVEGRKNLFDKMFSKFQIKPNIELCLKELRTVVVPGGIKLYPWAFPLLRSLIKNNIGVCILTNGNVRQQKNKINQINWEGYELVVYYANLIKPKPSGRIFSEAICIDFDGKYHKIWMVGDSEVDKLFAKNIEAEFIDVVNIENIEILQ